MSIERTPKDVERFRRDMTRIARILGSRKSDKKAASSRENGKKGGRPKKPKPGSQ